MNPNLIKKEMMAAQKKNLRAEIVVFEKVTPAQNAALKRLVQEIQSTLHVPESKFAPIPKSGQKT